MDLYVGNIHTSLEEDALRTLFSAFGPVVSSVVIKDRETGRSRGFGFVKMYNAADAERAIAELHGRIVAGRNLVVYESKPKEERQQIVQHQAGDGNYSNSAKSGYSKRAGVSGYSSDYQEDFEEEEVDVKVQDEAEFTTTVTDDGLVTVSFKH